MSGVSRKPARGAECIFGEEAVYHLLKLCEEGIHGWYTLPGMKEVELRFQKEPEGGERRFRRGGTFG